ncbi:unnamed protein product [Thlaspi arvense]|uniref:U-box domain-containing protein n=1 Tax=Thlaspi arvense TaxID=13288 RepID=A0AAU9RKQ7_THLAR|nr:unnamed protein product [Thlaspi arvense]
MKDPVTAVTGITYDRESIEQWLFISHNTTCPVSNQPLPPDSLLTPNHTLRRLIQSWCTQNAVHGIDRIPTPKPPLEKVHVRNLLRDLSLPMLQLATLRKLELLVLEHERNRKFLIEAGLIEAMSQFIATCHKRAETSGLEEALSVLSYLRSSSNEAKRLVIQNDHIIDTLVWVLGQEIDSQAKSHALLVLKTIISKASSSSLERLKLEFFEKIVGVITQKRVSHQGINAALHVMLDTCPWGRNRLMMVEAGAVTVMVELELESPEKRTTELILGILFHLCSCADGRAQLVGHAAGIAVVTKRLLRVSPAADDRALLIIALICKYTSNPAVIQEMLRVGTVTKLCMVLQVECAAYLKEKAKEVLRTHSNVWKKSPCVEVSTLLSRCSRIYFHR